MDGKYCVVERNEFTEVTLTLLDAMCDIARCSGSTQFEEIAVRDMANHFVNFYFVNFPQFINLDFISDNTEIDVESFKPLVDGTVNYKDNFDLFQLFRAAYVDAMLVELQASDVFSVGMYQNKEGNLTNYYNLKPHMLERKTKIKRLNNVTEEINTFGLHLLAERGYINGQLNVKKIRNSHFEVEYGNLCMDLSIGLLVYIAIGERYSQDKEQVIATILNYVDEMAYRKEEMTIIEEE